MKFLLQTVTGTLLPISRSIVDLGLYRRQTERRQTSDKSVA